MKGKGKRRMVMEERASSSCSSSNNNGGGLNNNGGGMDKNGGGLNNNGGGGLLKKGPWTSAEDAILVAYVKDHGEGNWNSVQKYSGLFRCGKSCRLRWANHLRPNLKKGAFTPEEERTIIDLHAKLGNKWARMAALMHGRTDNEIKNYWNTRIKRRMRAGLSLYPPEISGGSSNQAMPSVPSLRKLDHGVCNNDISFGGGIFRNNSLLRSMNMSSGSQLKSSIGISSGMHSLNYLNGAADDEGLLNSVNRISSNKNSSNNSTENGCGGGGGNCNSSNSNSISNSCFSVIGASGGLRSELPSSQSAAGSASVAADTAHNYPFLLSDSDSSGFGCHNSGLLDALVMQQQKPPPQDNNSDMNYAKYLAKEQTQNKKNTVDVPSLVDLDAEIMTNESQWDSLLQNYLQQEEVKAEEYADDEISTLLEFAKPDDPLVLPEWYSSSPNAYNNNNTTLQDPMVCSPISNHHQHIVWGDLGSCAWNNMPGATSEYSRTITLSPTAMEDIKGSCTIY